MARTQTDRQIEMDESQRNALQALFVPLDDRCRQLQTEHRRLAGCDELRQAKSGMLPALLNAVDRELQRVQLEISRFTDSRAGARAIWPPDRLAAMLDAQAAALAEIEAQQSLLQQCRGWTSSLQDIFQSLLQTESTAAAGIRNLARRVLVEVGRDVVSALSLPLPGLPVEIIAAGESEVDHPPLQRRVAARGIETARLAGWLALHSQNLSMHLESLVIAACLQDIGLLQIAGAAIDPAIHPEVSAALVSPLAELPIEVRSLIAAHHERLDGTGRPQGLTARRLSPAARLLCVAVRIVELWHEIPLGAETSDDIRTMLARQLRAVLTQLDEEAHRGELCSAWTAFASLCFGCQLPEREIWLPQQREAARDQLPPGLSEFGRRRLRVDRPHNAVSGPHFANFAHRPGMVLAESVRYEKL